MWGFAIDSRLKHKGAVFFPEYVSMGFSCISDGLKGDWDDVIWIAEEPLINGMSEFGCCVLYILNLLELMGNGGEHAVTISRDLVDMIEFA